MKILDFKEKKRFFVFGDIHGEFDTFFNDIKRLLKHKSKERENIHPLVKEEMDEMVRNPRPFRPFRNSICDRRNTLSTSLNGSVIFVCGDCGIGFNKNQYYIDKFKAMNDLLVKNKVNILFIRGNHDDPSYFSEDKLNFSNIQCIDDYTIVNVDNEYILCVGGSISVDRIWRKQQENIINKYKKENKKTLYWENEAPIFNENILKELVESNIVISHVITHDAPSFAEPTLKNTSIEWLKIDKDLQKDIDSSRKVMDSIFENLRENKHKLLTWTYGHYHMSFNNFIGEKDDRVLFIGLNELEGKNPMETRHMILQMEKKKSNEILFGDEFYQMLKERISSNVSNNDSENNTQEVHHLDEETLQDIRMRIDERIAENNDEINRPRVRRFQRIVEDRPIGEEVHPMINEDEVVPIQNGVQRFEVIDGVPYYHFDNGMIIEE